MEWNKYKKTLTKEKETLNYILKEQTIYLKKIKGWPKLINFLNKVIKI